MSKNPVKNSDDRKLFFLFEAILKQKTKKIAIFLILSAKLNRDIRKGLIWRNTGFIITGPTICL